MALKLANVFAWDIDFVLDIREGDRFTAVYEQIFQDGKYLRDGEVLAAEFVNNGKVYRAVRFVADSGHAGYYTPAGLAMRKAFLRAPVEFTRVSSAFNPHRQHPILNLIRGHMGTDYAAPTGTPVHAAGDGHVSFAGQRGGYGNAIVLTHGANISTLYGHMSRFARNIRVGTRVQQGEVIGYVGMTGLATGPHLHYEYLTGGVHRNPQTVQLPGAEPLRAQDLQRFRDMAAPLLAESVAAAAGRPRLQPQRLRLRRRSAWRRLRDLQRPPPTRAPKPASIELDSAMGIYLGLISGTSMDAIDAALVDFDVAPLRIIATSATPFEPAPQAPDLGAHRSTPTALHWMRLGQIDVELGTAFAQAAARADANAQAISAGPCDRHRQSRTNAAPPPGLGRALYLADRRSQHAGRDDRRLGGGGFSPARRGGGRPGRAAAAGVSRSGFSQRR